jgi:hypothetical protein
MFKRAWFQAVGVAAAALVTTVSMSTAASATSVEYVPTTIAGNGGKIAVMPTAIDDGDCRMTSASVELDPPAADGSMLVTWNGMAYTRHTNHADIWNLYLNVLDANGNFLFSLPVMHSASMTRINQVYAWTRFVRVQSTPADFAQIGQLQWIGTC